MIKVLIVEDSLVIQEFLTAMLSSDPEIQVVGTAPNGAAALEAVKLHRPDVITMDIHMPKMNGFDATRRIMETHPTPIVIVSGSTSLKELTTTFRAMESGALSVVQRPAGVGHPDHEVTAKELIQTVKLMAEVKVVRRWARPQPELRSKETVALARLRPSAPIRIVAIGASTGGPLVIRDILAGLPEDFPAPVLIVQHMASGFIQGFAEWLTHSGGFPVHVAAHGETPRPGHAYLAPDEFQMGVEAGGHIILSRDEPENGLRPSVSYLFRSVAHHFGPQAVGVLLTGMGKDGAEELKLMKEKGAITIAQDQESCVVYGMPGEAVKLDAAAHVLSSDKVATALISLVDKK